MNKLLFFFLILTNFVSAMEKDFAKGLLPAGRTAYEGMQACLRKKEANSRKHAVQKQGKSYTTPLHKCLEVGQLHIAYDLLKSKVDPNQRDSSGNTPLHIAARIVIDADNAFTTNAKILDNLKSEYERKQREIDSIPTRDALIREQQIVIRKIHNLEAAYPPKKELLRKLRTLYAFKQQQLDTYTTQNQDSLMREQQIIKSELKIIEANLHNLRVLFDEYYNIIIWILIAHGGHINIPNKADKTVEQLIPSLIASGCVKVIKQGNTEALTTILNAGANPNASVAKIPLLLQATCDNKQDCARLLLYHGAILTMAEEPHNLTALHTCSSGQLNEMIGILVKSPQGSPQDTYFAHKDIQKLQKQIYAFLSYRKRPGSNIPELPLEIEQKIYSFLLPNARTLIDLVSLKKLPTYKKFIGTEILVTALVERHMHIVHNALNAHDTLLGAKPAIWARLGRRPDGTIVIVEPNETSKLLEPAEDLLIKPAIKANYEEVLHREPENTNYRPLSQIFDSVTFVPNSSNEFCMHSNDRRAFSSLAKFT